MARKELKYPFIDGCKDLPKDKENNIREIRLWLETQQQLPKLSEEFLHLFLHCNYYNIEETKSNILAYFSLRLSSPEIFHDRSLMNPNVRNALDFHFFGIAPKRTPEGYQVIYITLNQRNVQNFVYADSMKATFILFDIMISESGLCPGYIFVYDSKPMTLSVFLKMQVGLTLKLTKYFQDAAPVRVLKVITINSVPFVDTTVSICRPFVKASVLNKLQFYGTNSDMTNFYKTIPRECVFDEYGGTAGSIEAAHENFRKLLESKYSKWIEDESIYAVEESKEEPKPAKRSFFSFCFYAFVPKRTPEVYRVIYATLNEKKLQNFVHADCAKATVMLSDTVTSECALCPRYVLAFNSLGFNPSKFFKLNISIILKIIRRFKLQLYPAGSDLTNFWKLVPRDCIFDDFGGSAQPIEAAHCKLSENNKNKKI